MDKTKISKALVLGLAALAGIAWYTAPESSAQAIFIMAATLMWATSEYMLRQSQN